MSQSGGLSATIPVSKASETVRSCQFLYLKNWDEVSPPSINKRLPKYVTAKGRLLMVLFMIRLRKVLEEKGLAENTVFIFMGDNGLFKGERQISGKWLMYDMSIRVPLIIYDPRANKHSDVDDMVLNIDIPKTVLSLAGVKVPEIYQGESLIPHLKGKKASKVRKSILFEHLWDFKPIPSSEAIRTKEWKYMRYCTIQAPEELYNLKIDPDEMNNLASDPKYKKIIEKLRKVCTTQAEKFNTAKLCSITDFFPYPPLH